MAQPPKIQKIMTQPINLIFRWLQNKSRIQLMLYEQTDLRVEGRIIVSLGLAGSQLFTIGLYREFYFSFYSSRRKITPLETRTTNWALCMLTNH